MDANDKMNNAAEAMRKAFFRHFPLCRRDKMTHAEISTMTNALAAIHCGEFLDWCARFGDPSRPLRDIAMDVVDAMLADPHNGPMLEALRGAENPMAFLTGKDH